MGENLMNLLEQIELQKWEVKGDIVAIVSVSALIIVLLTVFFYSVAKYNTFESIVISIILNTDFILLCIYRLQKRRSLKNES